MESLKVKDIEVVVFGYSRKSPDDKEDTERSIKNQEELNSTICKGKDWNLIKTFCDINISGSDRERIGIKNCISEAKKYKVLNPQKEVYIIVKDQDRFARDYSFMGDTLKDLEAYGVKVFSIIKNNFLDADDLGDIVTSVMNAQLIVQGRKKAILTRDKKIEQKLPCTPSPFGYKYDKKKNWFVIPKEAEIVKSVVNDSINKIDYKKTLLELKIKRTKRDRIISNAKKGLYNGIIKFNNKIKDSNKKIVRIEEIEYLGSYEKILSQEVFNKLNGN